MQEAGLSQALAGSIWTFGEVEFDEVRWCLRVAGAPVALEPKPLRILSMLLRRAGEVVTRDDLLAELWPGTPVVDKAVTNAVGKLRQALGPDGVNCISTVPKLGYRLMAEVQRQGAVAEARPSVAEEPAEAPHTDAPVAVAPEVPQDMPAAARPYNPPRAARWRDALRQGEQLRRVSAGLALLLMGLGFCGALGWEARQAQRTADAERRITHALQLRLLGAMAQAGLVDEAQREVEALRARLPEDDADIQAEASRVQQRVLALRSQGAAAATVPALGRLSAADLFIPPPPARQRDSETLLQAAR
ncbi:winged helix-turn-helix domain-containing protein [Ideonella azotifigens]|uniref:winged helix-turn-helix domain-containing protein n=1 Tax=Ideonella azotifigens TaxID=513160 RepID=UPI001E546A17|nr:winged helix-turn-helix domain-containing protein [Ideonella azotifigens]MCD2340644.1 winged helix-turn-helix domain-containing protein [Ideonella azotifigens]